MKKLLVSLSAILAGMPMMANAAAVAGDPVHATNTADIGTTNSAPKYALAPSDTATDGMVATAGYVKGAYNAAIKGINYVQSNIEAAASAFAQEKLTMDATYASQAGVEEMFSAATVSGSFEDATVSGTFTSATVGGTFTAAPTATIPTLTTWGTTTSGTAEVTASLQNAAINGSAAGSFTGSAAGSVEGSLSATYGA